MNREQQSFWHRGEVGGKWTWAWSQEISIMASQTSIHVICTICKSMALLWNQKAKKQVAFTNSFNYFWLWDQIGSRSAALHVHVVKVVQLQRKFWHQNGTSPSDVFVNTPSAAPCTHLDRPVHHTGRCRKQRVEVHWMCTSTRLNKVNQSIQWS